MKNFALLSSFKEHLSFASVVIFFFVLKSNQSRKKLKVSLTFYLVDGRKLLHFANDYDERSDVTITYWSASVITYK